MLKVLKTYYSKKHIAKTDRINEEAQWQCVFNNFLIYTFILFLITPHC